MSGNFEGACVLSLESRRDAEMARLIQKRGGRPLRAPSMREVPLTQQDQAMAFGETLVQGNCDVLVLLTGVGFSVLFDAMCVRQKRDAVLQALRESQLCCRGPKPVRVLKDLGLSATLVAPEPNTSQELLATIGTKLPITGKRVYVQEYGSSNTVLLDGLRSLGAQVSPVSVYGWQLPEDTSGLRAAVEALRAGQVDVAMFTSARQVEHLLQIADSMGQREEALRVLIEHVYIASVGPVTSDALRGLGIEPQTEPPHPKMGHLVTHTAAQWQARRADSPA